MPFGNFVATYFHTLLPRFLLSRRGFARNSLARSSAFTDVGATGGIARSGRLESADARDSNWERINTSDNASGSSSEDTSISVGGATFLLSSVFPSGVATAGSTLEIRLCSFFSQTNKTNKHTDFCHVITVRKSPLYF